MTIDIVERLRDHLSVIDAYPSQTRAADMGGVVQSIRLAADEIDRLRRALEVALPELEESYRFHRDMQADSARILRANVTVNIVRVTLGRDLKTPI